MKSVFLLLVIGLVASPAAGAIARTPCLIAEVQADPDLRIGTDRLWMDWAPDGSRLVYVDKFRRLMSLDLEKPMPPRQLSKQTGYAPRFRPDGKAIAFVGGRAEDARTIDTLSLQRVDGGDPIDLLPGERAVQSVSTAKLIHRWLEPTLLSYEEHMGTGVQQLFLLNVPGRRPTPNARLLATRFTWSPDGRRVVGHWTCCPSRFWVWDRGRRSFLLEAGPGAGPDRWFEAWSDDGQRVLYTEWHGQPYHPASRATLFRLDLETRQRTKLVDDGMLAGWSGSLLAFVRLGGTGMTLVVADARGGRIIWTDDLGHLPDRFDVLHWDYRPVFAGEYLFYRTGDGEWRVSTAGIKRVQVVVPRRDDVHVSWSPDGHHGALLDRSGRLRVIRNPLIDCRNYQLVHT